MRRQFGTRMYDTRTAYFVGTWEQGSRDSESWTNETLCRKRNGEYFLYGEGGSASKYAKRRASGSADFVASEEIMPLTDAEAHEWAKEHLDPVDVAQEFDVYGHGEFSDDELDEDVIVTFRLSRRVREALHEYARKNSMPRNAVVERLLRRELGL
ncbi:MAG: hypothetical protein Q4B30_03145 [Coriobacteriaceae bacterium]|nr:hypothetical protein [Coriobacteriaceae bacterium]